MTTKKQMQILFWGGVGLVALLSFFDVIGVEVVAGLAFFVAMASYTNGALLWKKVGILRDELEEKEVIEKTDLIFDDEMRAWGRKIRKESKKMDEKLIEDLKRGAERGVKK